MIFFFHYKCINVKVCLQDQQCHKTKNNKLIFKLSSKPGVTKLFANFKQPGINTFKNFCLSTPNTLLYNETIKNALNLLIVY